MPQNFVFLLLGACSDHTPLLGLISAFTRGTTDKSTCWPEQERCRAIGDKLLRTFKIKDGTLTLVLMGLFLAMGRDGRLSPLVIGKPPTVFTSTNSFLLATGLGTGAG